MSTSTDANQCNYKSTVRAHPPLNLSLHVKLASQEKCLYDAGITCVVIVVHGTKWNREANEVTSPYLDILCGTETTKDKNVQASPMNENNSPTIN